MAVAKTRSRFMRIEVTSPLASILPVRPVLQVRHGQRSPHGKGERPVDVVDWVQWEVEHDHMMDGWNVNSSRSDICTDKILLAQSHRKSQVGKGGRRNLFPWFTTKEF